jgi:hypothetical protein
MIEDITVGNLAAKNKNAVELRIVENLVIYSHRPPH